MEGAILTLWRVMLFSWNKAVGKSKDVKLSNILGKCYMKTKTHKKC